MIECYQVEIFSEWSTDAACAAPNQQRPGQSKYQVDSGSNNIQSLHASLTKVSLVQPLDRIAFFARAVIEHFCTVSRVLQNRRESIY